MAKLYFRYSAMNAGKSIDLLKVAYNYEERGQEVLLFTSALDKRYGVGNITSRIGVQKDAVAIEQDFDVYKYVLDYINNSNKKISCVLVDEAQFLTKHHIKQLSNVVDNFDIPVICYGLRTDFKGELFEGSYYLLALGDSIEEIKTICHCGRKATMNMRVSNGKPVYNGEQIQIGGNESYIAVCRKHYKEGKISS